MAKKKNSVLLIGLILILVLVIGFSYGYYLLSKIQENSNVVGSKKRLLKRDMYEWKIKGVM